MNWAIKYIENGSYIKISCGSFFSIREHVECFQKLFSSDFWKPGTNLLFDSRNLSFEQVTADKIRAIGNYYHGISPQLGENKIALLVNTTVGYGLGRQYQIFAENQGPGEIRIFKDEQEAAAWLNE